MTVFISYARANQAAAEQLRADVVGDQVPEDG